VSDEILYEVEDPVALITLNRPDALNAWTSTMDDALSDAVRRAERDPKVVGIIITGAGRGFSAGADMKGLANLADAEPSEAGEASAFEAPDEGDFSGRFTYLLDVGKPIIAAVNGPVAGMSYPLALCCDLRFVSPKALFVTAFSQRGLVAEWGLSWLLPRLVGPSVALDLLYSSRRVDGAEAVELGLANRLVEADDLVAFSRRYIEDLAANGAPASFAAMKRQVYSQMHAGLGAAELDSQRLMAESFARPDFAEGVKSFTEKRLPNFGRVGGDG
jgi:enoyl-CoA hydratase/carnithine racemase